jgi:hypothetical protein
MCADLLQMAILHPRSPPEQRSPVPPPEGANNEAPERSPASSVLSAKLGESELITIYKILKFRNIYLSYFMNTDFF